MTDIHPKPTVIWLYPCGYKDCCLTDGHLGRCLNPEQHAAAVKKAREKRGDK